MKLQETKHRGMVLPAVFAVLVLFMMVAFGLTQLGISSLGHAQSYSADDQALYAADSGLVRALAHYQMTGELDDGLKGQVASSGASYQVRLYSNIGSKEMLVPGGASIPPGTAYLVSEGTASRGRVTRRSAALCKTGVGSVQVGALARELSAINSTLAAYDSAKESDGYDGAGPDLGALLPNEVVLATNENSGLPIKLDSAKVQGTVFVGPGGDPNKLIAKTGETELRRQETLLEKIEVPEIEMPALPGQEAEEEELKTAQGYFPFESSSAAFKISRNASGEVTAINECFTLKLKPDGSFTVSESGSGYYGSGNLRTGEKTGNFPTLEVSSTSFSVGGHYHGMQLSNTGELIVDVPTNGSGDMWSDGGRQSFAAPAWMAQSFFGNPAEDLTNPDQIDTGAYGKVTISDATKTELVDGATIVAKDLFIDSGGTLNLADSAKNVTIYVTGKLEVSGENAILNATRSAKNIKIYYTGTEPVKLSGGSSSFLTLIAPKADIHLNGGGSAFYGALVGDHVKIENAAFYFDVATEGIGTGNGGTSMKVLSHFRL